MDNFNLSEYMFNGIENILSGAMTASLSNIKQKIFLMKFALSSKSAKKKRDKFALSGKHIPPFLIASITENCNLFCTGCYARSFKSCDIEPKNQMSDNKWDEIFQEASDIGISFMLLAGGEPLMRRDVIEKAAKHKNILFPVFTNGTLINDEYNKLFNKNRNLLPVISIEGNEKQTDTRRGDGTYQTIIKAMETLSDKELFFGASITVTKDNLEPVTNKEFIDTLYKRGCKIIFFIEYVPVDKSTKSLALGDNDRSYLAQRHSKLRNNYNDMIFISFPGDEKSMGGCLAAGRGFFHISSNGNAEPCPFSPYSDINITNRTLLDALNSKLFKKIRETDMSMLNHQGGCLLFDKEQDVKNFLKP